MPRRKLNKDKQRKLATPNENKIAFAVSPPSIKNVFQMWEFAF